MAPAPDVEGKPVMTQPSLLYRLAYSTGMLLCIVAVVLFLAGLPFYYGELTQVCRVPDALCPYPQLNEELAGQFHSAGVTLDQWAAYVVSLRLLYTGLTWLVGILILLRRKRDWMSLMTGVYLVTFGATIPTPVVNALAEHVPALGLPVVLIQYIAAVLSMSFLALFPNGRFVPSATKWVVLYMAIVTPFGFLFGNVIQDISSGLGFVLTSLGWLLPIVWFIFAQIYRYRRVSTELERNQTKWVMLGLVFWFNLILLQFYVEQLFASVHTDVPSTLVFRKAVIVLLNMLNVLILPLSIGIAILRSRLFDIDIIINRALVYGSLSGALIAIYFGSVILMQNVLRPLVALPTEPAIVLSTLVVAAMFNPLRNRIQSFIDRRFYRQKYDAVKTLAAFNARLRDEVNLEDLQTDIISVTDRTLQPRHVSLWLRQPQESKEA